MSTILSEKRTLSPWAKGGIGLGAGALLLVLVGLLFPTAAAFFPLVSLWCSCVLFYGALWVLHTAGVEPVSYTHLQCGFDPLECFFIRAAEGVQMYTAGHPAEQALRGIGCLGDKGEMCIRDRPWTAQLSALWQNEVHPGKKAR